MYLHTAYCIYLHACVTVFDSMTIVSLTGFPKFLKPHGECERTATDPNNLKQICQQPVHLHADETEFPLLFEFQNEHILQTYGPKRYASGTSAEYRYSDQLQVSCIWPMSQGIFLFASPCDTVRLQ